MRRLFWLAVGAGTGAVAVRKAQQAAQALTPSGLAGSARTGLAGMGQRARELADEVRAGMLEREIELREALDLDDHGVAR